MGSRVATASGFNKRLKLALFLYGVPGRGTAESLQESAPGPNSSILTCAWFAGMPTEKDVKLSGSQPIRK